jgi:hypothetical protein
MTTWLVLALLFVKHCLADFCWQTNRMMKDKGHFGRLGGFQHAGLHGALTYVILMHFLTIQACVMLAAFDMLMHYAIDWANRRISVRLTTEDNAYWVWFGIDQLLHYLTYLLIGFTVSILLVEYI